MTESNLDQEHSKIQVVTREPHTNHDENENYEISKEEKQRLSEFEIIRARIMLQRITNVKYAPFTHFGVIVELANQEKFLIHNSPSNHGEFGTEIIVSEDNINYSKWELHTDWKEAEKKVYLQDLVLPIEYSLLSRNCFNTVNRVWNKIVPHVEFDLLYDPKIGIRYQPINFEERVNIYLTKWLQMQLQIYYRNRHFITLSFCQIQYSGSRKYQSIMRRFKKLSPVYVLAIGLSLSFFSKR